MNNRKAAAFPQREDAPVVAITTPVMTKERFAEVSGMREGQIRGQLERGNLPTFNIGRLTLINVARLTWPELSLHIYPLMTPAVFASASGLRERQIESQYDNGNLPSRRVGRLVLVDVAKLTQLCLQSTSDSQGEDCQ